MIFHLEILDSKIWVHEDNTEDSIAEMLVALGVSSKEIVLGYFSEFHRKQTAFAEA